MVSYGYHCWFQWKKNFSIGFVFDGWTVSFHRGCNSKKLHLVWYSNIWRKTKKPIPKSVDLFQ